MSTRKKVLIAVAAVVVLLFALVAAWFLWLGYVLEHPKPGEWMY
ncbi:hypothetical protein [Gandjariella thermophila]|nr:hypothetical protein [Gandjariella thermophila]